MPSKRYKPGDYFVFRDRDNHGNFPALWANVALSEPRTARRYGHCVSVVGHINHQDRIKAFWLTKEDVLKISELILKKIVQRPRFITNTKESSDKLSRGLLEFVKRYSSPSSLSRLTNRQLANVYLQYRKLYADYHFINTIPWLVAGDKLADYLKGLLTKTAGKKETLKYFTLFATPVVPSYTFKQEIGFLEIVNIIESDKELSRVFAEQKPAKVKKLIQGRPVWALIKKHSKEFGWLPFDYVGPTFWNETHFIKEIKEFLCQGRSTKKEIAKLKRYHQGLKARQEQERKKLRILKKDFRLFEDLQALTVLQDNRKETAVQTHVWLEKVMRKEISKRLGVSVRALRSITEEEIEDTLAGKKKVAKQVLEKRPDRAIIRRAREGNWEIITDERVEKLWKALTPKAGKEALIRGEPAALGKATGIVRVLLSPADISKMQQDEILVASMTTPDYIPAMKKAKAIVTNEGGITCHAAIVSRELSIPCIIGTKVATRALKDGQLVEVDADKGVVKIMKR